MLHFNDAPEKAKRIFSRLVEEFEKFNINPTPLNYYVWYQYLKGENPQFRQEMDQIINDEYGYNDRDGRRLYDEYLSEEQEASSEFDRAFRRLVNLMIQKMNTWSDKLEAQTQQLDDCARSLNEPNLGSDELRRITDTMISTAHSINESNRAFQQEMLNNSEEVKKLRGELIAAQTAALTDELTEIGNRKAFNNALQELMLDAAAKPESLCLILSDIDHFKKFNDTYGHLIGDSVLRYYANIIKKEQGKNETVCRYGGEEFAILLSDTSLEGAKVRAENIRSAIEAATLKRKNSNEPLTKITASFGIAHYHGESDTAEEFINRADKALYEAKRQGRNRVLDELDLTETQQ
ncbi:GGDEF domain-containing protein [Thiomicrorhabdus cannonii]|uniref:GGDEF domain-containing protein n=1 Tax=Thiomicrorhabdus cannonii TaxID=2748011 RepID=UPI0015BF70D3|nr:GGDEF domain-containing protein [Thiomicrorhabdus cannonii]